MTPEVFKYYTLGVPKIDEEHFKLITLMEKIMECSKCSDHTGCDVAAEELFDCFERHLKEEETFMISINYPYYNTHLEYHNSLRRELKNVINRIRTNDYKTDRWITQTLRDIFVKHIDDQDLQIAQFINKNRM